MQTAGLWNQCKDKPRTRGMGRGGGGQAEREAGRMMWVRRRSARVLPSTDARAIHHRDRCDCPWSRVIYFSCEKGGHF